MEIKSQFLIVSFVNKILVCDVFSLKHLLKIETDENAIFDSNIEIVDNKHNLTIVYRDRDKPSKLRVESCKYNISLI